MKVRLATEDDLQRMAEMTADFIHHTKTLEILYNGDLSFAQIV